MFDFLIYLASAAPVIGAIACAWHDGPIELLELDPYIDGGAL